MTWKPGVSGNPGGKRKVSPEKRKEIKEMAQAHSAEAVAALREALTGTDRVPAAMGLLAYGYGRPVQTQNIRVIRSLEDLSEAELRAIVARGPPLIEGEAEEVAPDGD